MTSDIRLAFAHPAERSLATAGGSRDRISVRDMVLQADIGAFEKERGQPQRLRFNVVVEVAPVVAPLADDVDRILSYDVVTQAIEAALEEDRMNLLETLAEGLARRILAEPQAGRVFVRVEKLDRGPGALGVEIERSRADLPAPQSDTSEAPRPRVVYLSEAALGSPHLGGWIDRLVALDGPVILTVAQAPLPPGAVSSALVSRRLRLLAIEQSAWALADRDSRCVVVGTRTELDWGLRNGQLSVWAPSKMVLDAAEGPALEADAVTLAAWLGHEVEATALQIIGNDRPESASLTLIVQNPADPYF